MIEYLIKPTRSEWFNFPQDSSPYHPLNMPYQKMEGDLGGARIRVEECEISFSYEDPGIQVSFDSEVTQSLADKIIDEIRKSIEEAVSEPAEVVQIS